MGAERKVGAGEVILFDSELYEIGRLLDPEEKSQRLVGRYDLAVNALSVWHEMQLELRDEKNVPPIYQLIYGPSGELQEVKEKEELELELSRDSSEKYMPWYKRKRASEYWEVANEMADVMVLLVSEMLMDGFDESAVYDALRGKSEHRNKPLINEMIARTAMLGMDLAEIMIYKTEVNLQHRDPNLEPWVRGNHFMKRIRLEIGNEDSQIPHMAQGFLGETVLTRLQASAYSSEQAELNNTLFRQIILSGKELPSLIEEGKFGSLYSM